MRRYRQTRSAGTAPHPPLDARTGLGPRLHLEASLLPDSALQPADDAFEFLLSLGSMPERRTTLVRLWLQGYTLAQAARALRITPQAARRHVQLGLAELLELAPVTFAAACRKPVYRAPSIPTGMGTSRICRWCGYAFRSVHGGLTYCCDDCRSQARETRIRRQQDNHGKR